MSKSKDRNIKMLALMPWLVQNGPATFGDLSKRFKYDMKELLSDLMTFTMVGPPPYTPDVLTSLYFEPEDEVYDAYDQNTTPNKNWQVSIQHEDTFIRPPNLTPTEIILLLTSQAAIKGLHLKDNPTFRTAMEKIEAALDPDILSSLNVEVETPEDSEKFVEDLKTAAVDGMQVEMEYFSLSSSAKTKGRVEPWSVYFVQNAWYLNGYCHIAQARRTFRVDRITTLELTADTASTPKPAGGAFPASQPYTPSPNDPKVVLELDMEGRWAVDLFVAEEIKYLPDNKIHASLFVSTPNFLEKLLLQIGPHGRIVSGDYPSNLTAEAAKKLLAKYLNQSNT